MKMGPEAIGNQDLPHISSCCLQGELWSPQPFDRRHQERAGRLDIHLLPSAQKIDTSRGYDGWALGIVLKTRVRIPLSPFGAPKFKTQVQALYSSFQPRDILGGSGCCPRRWGPASHVGDLHWVPRFSLAHLWILYFGANKQMGVAFFPDPQSLFLPSK